MFLCVSVEDAFDHVSQLNVVKRLQGGAQVCYMQCVGLAALRA